MSDWSAQSTFWCGVGTIGSLGNQQPIGVYNLMSSALQGAAVWPASNRAIYTPFIVDRQVVATQMAFIVSTQSGNCDVGIYTAPEGVRLISVGSTAVGAAGIQVIDITDTTLNPGTYFMAMCVDNTTASFDRYAQGTVGSLAAAGVQQQNVGAVTLPDPATFANPAAVYVPKMVVGFNATL